MSTRRFIRAAGLVLLVPLLTAHAAPDVVLDWDFEEGTPGMPMPLARDSSGFGNHATFRLGTPQFMVTPAGAEMGRGGMKLSGSGALGSGMAARESATLNLALSPSFTVEVICRPLGDNTGQSRTLVQRSDPGTGLWSYRLQYDGDTRRAGFGVTGADGRWLLVHAPVPDDGRFHRLAGVFDRGLVSLHIDGVLLTNATTLIVPDPRAKSGTSVGATSTGEYYFNGEIARVRLARRALDAPEFLADGEQHFEGVPRSWWRNWFGDTWDVDPRARAQADPDGDGRSNLAEFQGLTDPLDPDSGFSTSLGFVPRFSWRSIPGGVYRIERRETPQSSERVVLVPEFMATGRESTYLDHDPRGPGAVYSAERVR